VPEGACFVEYVYGAQRSGSLFRVGKRGEGNGGAPPGTKPSNSSRESSWTTCTGTARTPTAFSASFRR
jgi:hypothetical protein